MCATHACLSLRVCACVRACVQYVCSCACAHMCDMPLPPRAWLLFSLRSAPQTSGGSLFFFWWRVCASQTSSCPLVHPRLHSASILSYLYIYPTGYVKKKKKNVYMRPLHPESRQQDVFPPHQSKYCNSSVGCLATSSSSLIAIACVHACTPRECVNESNGTLFASDMDQRIGGREKKSLNDINSFHSHNSAPHLAAPTDGGMPSIYPHPSQIALPSIH